MLGRVSRSGIGPPKSYRKGHVWILDDVDPEAQPRVVLGQIKQDPYTYRCKLIRELFSKYSDYDVKGIRFNPGTKKRQVVDVWKNLFESKGSDELVIIYYHGKAGNEDEDYTWKFTCPKTEINAYELIDIAVNSKADIMFLLDCFIHTRIKGKWKISNGSAAEILARPERMCDADGKIVDHMEDFTIALASHLEEYIEQIDKKYGGHRAMVSIPGILASTNMYSNPIRIWLDSTRKGAGRDVYRFKLNPSEIRQTGMLNFYAVQIQQRELTDDDVEDQLLVQVDEAYESEDDENTCKKNTSEKTVGEKNDSGGPQGDDVDGDGDNFIFV